MEFMQPHWYWLIGAIALVILEIFTAGFAAIFFAIGAFATALAAYLEVSFTWQLAIFAVVSALSFILFRPFLKKFLERKEGDFKTNADSIIGRKALVIEKIDEAHQSGYVKLDGEQWKAVSQDGSVIEEGESVVVVSKDSIILTVTKQ